MNWKQLVVLWIMAVVVSYNTYNIGATKYVRYFSTKGVGTVYLVEMITENLPVLILGFTLIYTLKKRKK